MRGHAALVPDVASLHPGYIRAEYHNAAKSIGL